MPTTYAIPNGRTVMDATTYTGDGTNGRTITNQYGFKPDFVWIKSRSNALNNNNYDSNRGAPKEISSNLTSAESDGDLTAFASNGFTINQTAGYEINHSGYTYVGWQWQAGQGTTSSNTDGSITSTVSVNATAGFSIVTYTGNATSGATVGHGLGVTPQFIIIKVRSVAGDAWIVWSGAISQVGYLNLTDAFAAGGRYTAAFNSTAPTSSVITLGTSSGGTNTNGATYVAYCWAQVAGFSAFGSYTGNGSSDGPFIYTNFQPKFVMIKRTDSTGQWCMFDTSRSPYNVVAAQLAANDSAAEDTSGTFVDILSNGFKCRNTAADKNASGGTYIYAAFASNPFKFSTAR